LAHFAGFRQGLEGQTKGEEQLLCQLAHNGAAHATLWRKKSKSKEWEFGGLEERS